MCIQAEPAVPSSTVQALAMVRAGLGYLSACDAASLGTPVLAEALNDRTRNRIAGPGCPGRSRARVSGPSLSIARGR